MIKLATGGQISLKFFFLHKENLDLMLQWLLQKHHQQEVLQAGLCIEGALLLLGMLKAIMNQVRLVPHTAYQKVPMERSLEGSAWFFFFVCLFQKLPSKAYVFTHSLI